MKIAVINFSGNVGKSTIANHLLAPRFPNALVIPVESINDEPSGAAKIRGKEYATIAELLFAVQSVIVDVGSSNVEQFLDKMEEYEESHQLFDVFVVPTTPDPKQQSDTIRTIAALSNIGVEPDRIRVLFNMHDKSANFQDEYSQILQYQGEFGLFTGDPGATLVDSELYTRLIAENTKLCDILADETDHKAKAAEAKNQKTMLKHARAATLKMLANATERRHIAAFKAMFPEHQQEPVAAA